MRGITFLFCLLCLACSTSIPGQCSVDADCVAPAVCLTTQSPHLCVVPQGQCFPACASGQTCVSGVCQTTSSGCSPPCASNQTCVNNVCKDVTQASIDLTSPGPNDYVGAAVQATATAAAPGGVTSVRFEVRQGGAVVASATAATPVSGANFAAAIDLSGAGVTEGAASIAAVLTYPTGTLSSATRTINIDRTPPVISMGSFDGRALWMGPANNNVTVTATVSDAGIGVKTSSVTLTLSNGKSYAGTAGASSQFSFTVPMADLGTATSVTFKVDASDQLGNAAPSLIGLPTQVVQIDAIPPSLSITADSSWHAADATLVISGPASDAQSGAGSVTLTSTANGGLTQAVTISGGNFSVSVNLAMLTFPAAFEGPWAFTVTAMDKAGNQTAKTGSLNIDNKAPTVGTPAIATAADYHDPAGNIDWYRAGSGTISVTAVISDGGSGVQSTISTPCIAVSSSCYGGTRTSGDVGSGTYTFSLPRSEGTGKSGPVTYTINAQDALGYSVSNTGQIYFDDTVPTVSIAPDAIWYTRSPRVIGSSSTIVVNATISDTGSGLSANPPSIKVGNGAPVPGAYDAPNSRWQFNLDATLATAGVEGPLSFSISAQDQAGNTANAASSRNVDDKAPVIQNVRVVLSGVDPTTASNGVNPPTGYLYSDNIAIYGEITDQGAGLSVSAAQKIPSYELDGIALGGGAATVPPVQISGCTNGQRTKCTFTVTGISMRSTPFFASSGNLPLTIAADDLAVGGDGSAERHRSATTPLNIPVTRFKWSTTLSALSSVSGLAVHPNGDVIVTGAGATASSNTVIALFPDGSIHWQKGNAWYSPTSHIGPIDGAPSIGAGGNTSPIYVATGVSQDLIALNPSDGSRVWQCGAGSLGAAAHNPPAVVAITSGASPCEAVFVGDDLHRLNGACMNTSTTCTIISANANIGCNCAARSPAVKLGAKLYLGFDLNRGVSGTALGIGLTFGATTVFTPTAVNTITNLSTDGTQIYAVDPAASRAYGMTAIPGNVWNVATSAAINGAAALEPASGGLIVSTGDKKLHSLAQSNGTDTVLQTFASGNGSTPLLGSNGYMYMGNTLGVMLAVQDTAGYATAWSYSPGATAITAASTLDCSGILYFTAGNVVYAVITDSVNGLRQGSPWPKYQRDSRNSGNADAATLWGAQTASGCTQ